MDEEKIINHLQLIQEPIGRMSTTSAVYKGFSAAILAGMATASYTDINKWAMLIAFIPILSFLGLDVYYLRTEKKFRFLYEQVRNCGCAPDYSVRTALQKQELKKAKAGIWDCLCSPSIWLFYVPILVCSGFLVALKFMDVL
ncbi:hypothetical protein ACG0Z4_10360 [Enterocloster aldenensis]|uniref:hypothetical protein n=1 Tax=Enterocloster aldenensis TaxID=358742 RepID=UPI000E474D7D|nr:hypothetical protein DW886_23705 [Enterocloster aldenensis]